MINAAKLLKVRMLVFFRWKFSQATMLEALRLFEATEDDSAWQLLRAAEHVSQIKLKAELFGQVMEEAFHAQEFRRVYKQLSGEKLQKISLEKKPLYPREQAELIFPYCLVGEQSAAERFQLLSQVLPEGPLKHLLKRIVADEVGHIHKAQEILELLEMDRQVLQKRVMLIKWQRLKEAWLRTGRKITDSVAEIFLSLVFYASVGIFKGLQSFKVASNLKFKEVSQTQNFPSHGVQNENIRSCLRIS